jgi:hypothetical protein
MLKQLSLILCILAVACNSYAGVFPTGNTPNTSVTATVTGKVPYSGAVSDLNLGTHVITAGTAVIGATAFASLGTPANGTFKYCNDCTVSTPSTCTLALLASCTCAGSGSGALAKRLNGSWYCN